MRPMKPFKKLRRLSKSEAQHLYKQDNVFALPVYSSDFKSLEDLLERLPSICSECGSIMPDSLLIRSAGAETFDHILLEEWVHQLCPPKTCRSDAELEQERQRRKDVTDGIIRQIVQVASADEYIVCLDTLVTNGKKGEMNDAYCFIHSDSLDNEKCGTLPYEQTRDGFVFGELAWNDSAKAEGRRFVNLRRLNSSRGDYQ
jgi:hypothetical protein